MSARLLIVEDDRTSRETLLEAFTDEGYDVVGAADGAEAIAALAREEMDCVVTDLVMPRADGIEVLTAASPVCPVILITAHGTVDNAVDAMKQGAFDFVTKPIHLPHLFALVARAVEMRALERAHDALKAQVAGSADFSGMIGRDRKSTRLNSSHYS